MSRASLARMTAVTLALAAPAAAIAQLPPAAELLPPGFKRVAEKDLGVSAFVQGRKPNAEVPRPHADPGVVLEVSWIRQAMPAQVVEQLARQPEDPPGRHPGSATREEPCGKARHQGGVLSCRKVITPWAGGGSGPELVTWRIGWTGAGAGGVVSILVSNLAGSKDAAMAWIDAIIPKVAGRG